MKGPLKPCRECGIEKALTGYGYQRSPYCDSCRMAMIDARAKASSLCGECDGQDECGACKRVVIGKSQDAALRAVQSRRENYPTTFRPSHADKKFQARANSKVHWAIKKGLLPSLQGREYKCSDCSNTAVAYDHRDYGNPLDVQPVCLSCNWKRGTAKWPRPDQHNEPNKAKRRAA